MVRVPSEPVVIQIVQIVAFPEPDHVPELEAQVAYEELRDGDPWAGIEDARAGSERQGSVQLPDRLPVEIHRGPRGRCSWPSHAGWFLDKYPEYRGREDRHT